MKLLFENWREYLDEAYIDTYAGFAGRKTRASLHNPLKDPGNEGSFSQSKNTLKNILTFYAIVDAEENILTRPEDIKGKYPPALERFLPEEWARGNIENPELKELVGEKWKPLAEFSLQEWHRYKKHKINTLTHLRKYLFEGNENETPT
jgi:hypothetical protein